MVSRAPALDGGDARAWTRLATGALKAIIGLGLLAALVVLGRIDLKALSVLGQAPAAVALCGALILLTIPLTALRWGIVLRVLGLSIPFASLLHIVAISLLANVFLFGPTTGDAVRGVYAWRAIGGASGRVAVSIVADRLISLFGLLSVALVFTLFNWHRMQQVPALAVLGTSLLLSLAIAAVVALALCLAPLSMRRVEQLVSRRPRVAERLAQLGELILLIRAQPVRLLAACACAVAVQALTAAAVVVIAAAIDIGSLSAADFLFAAPLTLMANALPLTPNGIGIGEAAFDQICRWLEPAPSGAAYSSIFFAYRAISMVAWLAGLISFVVYRNEAASDPAGAQP